MGQYVSVHMHGTPSDCAGYVCTVKWDDSAGSLGIVRLTCIVDYLKRGFSYVSSLSYR